VNRARTTLVWAVLVVAMAFALFPYLWMLRTAFAEDSYVRGISLLPERWTLENFAVAWTDGGMGAALVNGALVSLGILALQLLTGVPAAYAFAKIRFRGRSALYALVLASLIVPAQAIAVPMFLGINSVGLSNTYGALILPFATSAFGIFLMRQHMVTIPDALLDAARMDGYGHVRTLTRVVVPIARPAIFTFALFSLFASWNEYLWPLLVARAPAVRTPPLALALLQNDIVNTHLGVLAAAAVIVTIPIVILFVLTRRSFVAGFTGGEVTG
jgi:multiple sugar transport system permease protein